jgi:hypothetical protein
MPPSAVDPVAVTLTASTVALAGMPQLPVIWMSLAIPLWRAGALTGRRVSKTRQGIRLKNAVPRLPTFSTARAVERADRGGTAEAYTPPTPTTASSASSERLRAEGAPVARPTSRGTCKAISPSPISRQA